MKICFDYGHGGTDPGAINNNRKESDDVIKIGREIRLKLVSLGIEVDEIRKKDEFISLASRASRVNSKNYDYLISFHRNAYMLNKANGVEIFLYPKYNKLSYFMARNILKSLENIGFKNRGIKTKDFYILRNTKSKAMIIELGFIDSDLDNAIFDCKYYEIVDQIALAIYKSVFI